MAAAVTVAALLAYISRYQWGSTNLQYNAVRRAVARRIILKGNPFADPPYQLTASTVGASYELDGAQAGQVMHDTVRAQFPGQDPHWKRLEDAFLHAPYLTVKLKGWPGPSKVVCLDINSLIFDAALSAGLSPAAAVPAAIVAGTALTGTSRGSVSASVSGVGSSSSSVATSGQQQQHMPSTLPLQSLQRLPMPQGLEILASVSRKQCADAVVVLVPQDLSLDGQVQQLPLLELLAHIGAARLCALDLEFAQATPLQLQQFNHQQQQAGMYETAEQDSAGSSNSNHGPRVDVLALMQLFVPAVQVDSQDAWLPDMIYVVEVPQQQKAAAGLLDCLRGILQDPGVVKVMHDARCDHSVLQRQFGITLAGVLDTQVLAGMAALAAAVPNDNGSSSSSSGAGHGVLLSASGAAAGSSSQATTSGGHNNNSSSSSSSSSSGWSDLGRIGLGKLYEAYGCPHPRKNTVGKSFDDNPRLWFSRPLASEALQYAADDVRYLLSIAHSLLHTLPALTMQLSSINMQLGLSRDLRLQKGLIPGYSPLMHSNAGSAMHGTDSSSIAGQEVLQQPGLTDICFELKLDQSVPGWYLASYQLHLNEQQAGRDDSTDPAKTATASLVGAEGNTAYLSVPDQAPAGPEEECTDSSGASSSNASSSNKSSNKCSNSSSSGLHASHARQGVFARFSSLLQARATASPPADAPGAAEAASSAPVVAASAAPAVAELSPAAYAVAVSEDDNSATSQPEVDEAVYSMMQLLPHKLHPFLQPYLDPACKRSLIEVVLYNKRNVELRFSDGDSIFLEARSRISQALELLAAAKEQWQQQGDESADSSVDLDDEMCETDTPQQPALPNSNMQHSNRFQSSYSSLSLAKPAGAALARARSIRGRGAAGDMFRSDERLGVPSTLHRIAAMRNLSNEVIGLTYRIGRHVPGVAMMLGDLLSAMKASLQSNRPLSLLILGRPGVGKTTLLRDIARLLSLTPEDGGLGRKVVIVDTSNEIAGDADEMHPCVGRALRMMLPRREHQAKLLVQAVQNHNPQVLIVDEIGTKEEVEAAKTMAPRGALLIGTAHGHSLSDLLRNHVLNPLVGGVREVTLGDAEAKASNAGQKTRYERAGAAPFVALLELKSRDSWRLHMNVERSVDARFAGRSNSSGDSSSSQDIKGSRRHQAPGPSATQLRIRDASGRVVVKFETAGAARDALKAAAMVKAAVQHQQQQQQQQQSHNVGAPSDLGSDGADDHDVSYAAAAGGGSGGFKGGWFVDLFHAGIHRAIEASAGMAMEDLTCSTDRVVRLQFTNCNGMFLFAHPVFLSAWSGVLRNLLEDVQEVSTPRSSNNFNNSNSDQGRYITVPLDDSDTAAWEDALALMHPSRQLLKISWESAARLLLLARKYDMPAVTGHIEAFLMEDVVVQPDDTLSTTASNSSSTATSASVTTTSSSSGSSGGSSNAQPYVSSRLAAHLTAEIAADWLHLTSVCGLDPQADICIDYMIQHQVPMGISLLSSIQPQHADTLLSGLLQQLQAVSDKAAKQEQTLATAALPIETPTRRARCPECKATWYKLPDGKSAPHCFNCGRRRPIILGELYALDKGLE